MLGYKTVGWHSEHWHWLLVGILCWGETLLCKLWFISSIYLNLISSILQSYTLGFPPPSTRCKNKQQNICFWFADTSRLPTATSQQRSNVYKGECMRRPAKVSIIRRRRKGFNYCSRMRGWAGRRLLRDQDFEFRFQPSPYQHVSTGLHDVHAAC